MVHASSILLQLFLVCTTQASSSLAPAAVTAAPSLNATCPFRTINYITHGLPQKCLKTSWKAGLDVAATSSTESLSVKTSTTTSFHAKETKDAQPDRGHIRGNVTTPVEANKTSVSEVANDKTPEVADTSSLPSSVSMTVTPGETEEASPLDDTKFMSFEEWKKQNLQKAGQSEQVGNSGRGAIMEKLGSRKRSTNINTALDSLGDEAEIDLDFSGFISDTSDLVTPPQPPRAGESMGEAPVANPSGARFRSADAGKTCKERFNYASFDCAAQVLKHNSEATSAAAVLGENKDIYMLNQCSAQNKFLILELCDDIWIDTIVLANFEFFSSIFRTFRVSLSDKYPVKIDKWTTIGTFEARHTRDVQAFLVENPIIWARYVRIEFLTHYGSEYYCPLSLVRVHGTTMLEEYKRDQETARGEDEALDEAFESIQEPQADVVPSEGGFAVDVIEGRDQESTQAVDHSGMLSTEPSGPMKSVDGGEGFSSSNKSPQIPSAAELKSNVDESKTCKPQTAATTIISTNASTTIPATTSHPTTSMNSSALYNSSSTSASWTENISATAALSNQSMIASQVHSKTNSTAVTNSASNSTSTEKSKASQTSSQPQASPTMQESFFKSVQKRLQMLEANSSLSLQYIEDQSRALRDAFTKVEQRQLGKTTAFLDYLNTTVLSELRDFRQQYDQLWQSTVIELDSQRERYQQETAAINARLGILADEVIFQKRISIVQMVLVLVCLALVLFGQGGLNQYLEMPLVQHVLSRSPSTKLLNLNNFDTPTQSPPVTRQSSLRQRHGILKGHRRLRSEDSIDSSLSPEDIYRPVTPVSLGSDAETEEVEHDQLNEPPDFDPSTIERPSTSPPILPSSSPPSTPRANGHLDHESIDMRLLDSPAAIAGETVAPTLIVEGPTPPAKHLTWNLPNG